MATRSTILDANSFSATAQVDLGSELTALTARRADLLGPAYRLFYKRPVHLVRGQGTYLYDPDGQAYLDVYNNVASVGHCHPKVVEAIAVQASRLNTHTRYLHEQVLDYAERLLATAPAAIDQAMFVCTGSEANDLAIRVAQAATGNKGVIVTAEAYHGNTDLVSGVSPALGDSQPLGPAVVTVRAPDPYRSGGSDLAAAQFAADTAQAITSLKQAGLGVAALLVDSIFSSDGVFPSVGALADAVKLVQAAGGILIADEVQPGFARTGQTFWGFARHGLTPQLTTIGKPMGNGMPVAGLLAQREVLAAFADRLPYFNTFGGNPVSMAAAAAVLAVIEEEDLQTNASRVGSVMLAELTSLADSHPALGNVRGAGLYIGLDVVHPSSTEPDSATALELVEALRDRRVLTSVCGPGGNVLKLRPPLVFNLADVDWLLTALEDSLKTLGL